MNAMKKVAAKEISNVIKLYVLILSLCIFEILPEQLEVEIVSCLNAATSVFYNMVPGLR